MQWCAKKMTIFNILYSLCIDDFPNSVMSIKNKSLRLVLLFLCYYKFNHLPTLRVILLQNGSHLGKSIFKAENTKCF